VLVITVFCFGWENMERTAIDASKSPMCHVEESRVRKSKRITLKLHEYAKLAVVPMNK
jgi:hypothetical protein